MSRTSPNYRAFVKSVLRRDGGTCQHCGTHENVDVHHIKPYQHYPDLRTDIDNGLSLCEQCHNAEHANSIKGLHATVNARNEWKQAVLKRDGGKCIKCGSSEHVTAHGDSNDVSEGQTICKKCVENPFRMSTGKLEELDLNAVYKWMKTGAELSTVLIAFGIPAADIPKIQIAMANPLTDWWVEFRSKVIQCRAHAKLLVIQKMFTEGGYAGAKYLLERMEQSVDNRFTENQKLEIENVAEIEESEVIDGEWDWNAN